MAMALLSASDAQEVSRIFDGLTRDVHIRVYTRKLQCPSCSETEMILRELAELNDRLRIEFLNPLTDEAGAAADGVDRVPALVVSDGTHSRVRFFGTPSGYEFSSLLTCIMDAGTEAGALSASTMEFLSDLTMNLDINVFVTPTCPHCPSAAVLASRLAAASGKVVSTVIEANEFEELSRKYRVQGVPRTVINERFFAEGSMPESMLVPALARAMAEAPGVGPVDLSNYLTQG
jgi:glutaredoxin-like protein